MGSCKKILITGSTGMLAPYLCDVAEMFGIVVTVARHGGDISCDLAEEKSVQQLILDVDPDWIVHAAGMTDVEQCEKTPHEANASNHKAVANLAKCIERSKKLVFISTDQVYPDKCGPHRELNVGPVNEYGKSKLLGEQAAYVHPGALILRTNIIGPSLTKGRDSLDDFMARAFRNKTPITLFADVFFSPLHMKTLSVLVFEMLQLGLVGIFNVGSNNGMSKAQFGYAVANHLGLSAQAANVGVSHSLSGRVPRPHDLRMDVTFLEKMLGRRMPTLQQEVEKI